MHGRVGMMVRMAGCDTDWAVGIADDDGRDCDLEVRGPCCGGMGGW